MISFLIDKISIMEQIYCEIDKFVFSFSGDS